MASSYAILNDVDLRYRNTFTTDQKLIWLNQEQQELFDVLEVDSPPYAFVTVEGENFYPFPAGFDLTKIKTVTMQLNSTSPDPEYVEVPFRRNDNDVYAPYSYWYTIVSDAMYLYYTGGVPDAMNVYVFCDAEPTPVTTDTLNVSPDLPAKYQELLVYGILRRIAEARKDVTFQQNYDAQYQQKLADILWLKHGNEPEYVQPTSSLPRRNGSYYPVWNGW